MQNAQLSSFIARNINSFVYPESLPFPPTTESLRSHFFTRGMLLFYPRLECSTCNMTYYDEFDFPEDQEITTVECPGCQEQHTPKLTIQGFDTETCKGQRRVQTRSAEQFEDKELEELYKDCTATSFSETVDWLGIEQLQFQLAKLMLSQPLLCMTSIELVKKQPTLAYNLRFAFDTFEMAMVEVFTEFIKQSKIEAFRREGVKHSVGDILPANTSLPDEYADVIVLEEEEEEVKQEEEVYDKLVTYVFQDRRKGENMVSLRTYHGDTLIKDGKITIRCLVEQLESCLKEFNCKEYGVVVSATFFRGIEFFTMNYNLLAETDLTKFGEPYVNQEVDSCVYCTEPIKGEEKNCSECDAPVRIRPEVHVILEPVDEYGYQYNMKVQSEPDISTEHQSIAFSELSFHFQQIEAELIEASYRFNKVKVKGPCMLNLNMPTPRWEYVAVRELDYLSTSKLQEHIQSLKDEYEMQGDNADHDYDYYRAALDYQFPKPATKPEEETMVVEIGPTMDEALREAVEKLKIRETEEEADDEKQ